MFNGLDYMALHNIYRLHYGLTNQFYNPENPTANSAFGSGHIDGPEVLCPVNIGNYHIVKTYPVSGFSDVVWHTSANLEVLSPAPQYEWVDISANTALIPSFVQASFNENRAVRQHYPAYGSLTFNGEWVSEKCFFTYRKPIFTQTPEFQIYSDYDECSGTLIVFADGEDAPGATYNWEITQNGTTTYEQGQSVDIPIEDQTGGPGSGSTHLALTVSGVCPGQVVTVEKTVNYHFDCSHGIHRAVVAYPNPTSGSVSVLVTRGYTVSSGGLDVMISRTDGSPQALSRTIYSNGEPVDVSALPDGLYNLQVAAPDLPQPLNTSFVISR